jgi:hypothetical protein
MATYAVCYSEDDDYAEAGPPARRYKYRSEADAHLEHERERGVFARIVRWDNGQPTEVARVNDPATVATPPGT